MPLINNSNKRLLQLNAIVKHDRYEEIRPIIHDILEHDRILYEVLFELQYKYSLKESASILIEAINDGADIKQYKGC